MRKKQVLAMGLSLLFAFSSLVGCGFTGGGGEKAATKTESSKAAEEGKADVQAAEGDQVLSVVAEAEIKTLVPWMVSENQTFLVLNQAQEGLFRMDKDNIPQPALCEKFELSEDKSNYTFHLRDAKWSNGEPVKAEDFVFAWLKQMSADAGNGYSFIMTDYIVNGEEYNAGTAKAEDVAVKAVDDKTLEVSLKSPTPYFLNLTTMTMFFPVNEKFYNEQGEKFSISPENMLFCGPYQITEYDPSVGVSFVKNEQYWDKDNVKIEKAKVRVMKDASAALNAYQAGELSQVKLTSADVAANENSPEFSKSVDFRTTYLQFNLTDPVLGNANMRKAISLAFDRQLLVKSILADGSAAGTGLVADGLAGDGKKSFRELNGEVSPFNKEEAAEYYKKAVEELGKAPESITLLIGDDSVLKTIATFMQSELEKNLGLKVEIDTKTMQGRGQQMDANDYQMGLTAWGADYDDAMTYLDLWTNGTPYRGNYKNDAYNALIKDAKAETDDAKRLQDMLDAEKMLCSEDAVVAPVVHRGSAMLTKPNVKNLITHPIGVPMEFKYAYFE